MLRNTVRSYIDCPHLNKYFGSSAGRYQAFIHTVLEGTGPSAMEVFIKLQSLWSRLFVLFLRLSINSLYLQVCESVIIWISQPLPKRQQGVTHCSCVVVLHLYK